MLKTTPSGINENGHIDGQILGDRKVTPADSGMIWHWNEAVKKFREQGIPPLKSLMK